MSLYSLLQQNKKRDASSPYGMDMTAYGYNPTDIEPQTHIDSIYSNEYFNPSSTMELGSNDGKGFFELLNGGDMVKMGFGAGQLALGLANYFENKKLNKAGIDASREQVTNSRYARNRHKDFVSNTKSAMR